MDQIIGQRWNLTAVLLYVLIRRLKKEALDRARFLEQYLHGVDVLDRVQSHMNDVSKAKNGCSNLQEEASGVPANNGYMPFRTPNFPTFLM